jgi:mannose-6-phosphate isomerase-like protein (cupin superfamily)
MKTRTLMAFSSAVCLSAVLLPYPVRGQAQTQGVKVYTQAQLLQMEQKLQQGEDKKKGVASETLDTYVGRHTMLATRSKDGQAEMHEKFADFFVVVEGEATLVSGGTMVNSNTPVNGESLGDSVQGGERTKLGKGDVVQIPPNIPHQLLVPAGKTFTYFVIKIQEHP